MQLYDFVCVRMWNGSLTLFSLVWENTWSSLPLLHKYVRILHWPNSLVSGLCSFKQCQIQKQQNWSTAVFNINMHMLNSWQLCTENQCQIHTTDGGENLGVINVIMFVKYTIDEESSWSCYAVPPLEKSKDSGILSDIMQVLHNQWKKLLLFKLWTIISSDLHDSYMYYKVSGLKTRR